ncbi:MAG: c-type cytochrome [Pseudomonadota bacterium]
MHKRTLAAAGLLTLMLAACAGTEGQPPVEQIEVRAPGDPDPNAAGPAISEAASDVAVDLVAKGEAAFAVCSGCHVAEASAASTAGPNLHGVVGRQAGTLDDYAYSDALASSGITWDIAELDRFLANPAGRVEGTTMVAGGVSDGESRAAIVAYLGSLSE